MISRKTVDDPRHLRPVIQKRLDDWCKDHNVPFTLKVSEETVQQDEWTYYIVVPGKGDIRAYDYASALTEVEATLRKDKPEENVLLVPALPD
jgi:hypothetical protein